MGQVFLAKPSFPPKEGFFLPDRFSKKNTFTTAVPAFVATSRAYTFTLFWPLVLPQF